MVRVVLLGRLSDMAEAAQFDAAAATLGELRAVIGAVRPELAAAIAHPSVRVAIDRTIVTGDVALDGVHEVAFMPPLSGG